MRLVIDPVREPPLRRHIAPFGIGPARQVHASCLKQELQRSGRSAADRRAHAGKHPVERAPPPRRHASDATGIRTCLQFTGQGQASDC